jgi:hypothetical protein
MSSPTPPHKPIPPNKPTKTINKPISFPVFSCYANKPSRYDDEVEIELNIKKVQAAINELANYQEESQDTMYGTLRIVIKMDRCDDDVDFLETAEVYCYGDADNENYENEMIWYNKSFLNYESCLVKYQIDEKEYSGKLKEHLEIRKEKQKIIDEIKMKEVENVKMKKKMDAEIAEMKKKAGIK